MRQCSRRLTECSASAGNSLQAAAGPDLPRRPVGGAERKTGREINGDAAPYGIQYLLNRARWSVAEARTTLCGYVQEHLSPTVYKVRACAERSGACQAE